MNNTNPYNSYGKANDTKQQQTISVVIAKPTRVCNAHCTYCSSPPLEEMGSNWEPEWSFEKFKYYFDCIYPHMLNGAHWIWHGGEPMLMGVDFYKKTHEYAQQKMKETGRHISFSMQSNLLGYNDKWYPIFKNIFNGSLSTSYDPDETNRTIKNNPKKYTKIFKNSFEKILNNGFRPMVISVYNEKNAHLMQDMYEWSLSKKDKSFPIRLNYCYPAGRLDNQKESITPETYGNELIKIYNRWIKETPNFTVTPLDQMFKKVIGIDGNGHCPWTKKCGGRFIEIEPNGDIYNCSDFADLDKKYCFGNINTQSFEAILNSKPAFQIRRRSVNLPQSCLNCEHFNDCEGGCARDAALFQHGIYGKFHYCKSWKMIFTRIKESILKGEADNLLSLYGENPSLIKSYIKNTISNHFQTKIDFKSIETNGSNNQFGFGNNNFIAKNEYNEHGEYLPTKTKEFSNEIKPPLKTFSKLSQIRIIVENKK